MHSVVGLFIKHLVLYNILYFLTKFYFCANYLACVVVVPDLITYLEIVSNSELSSGVLPI